MWHVALPWHNWGCCGSAGKITAGTGSGPSCSQSLVGVVLMAKHHVSLPPCRWPLGLSSTHIQMVMMSGIFAAFAALRNQLKGSTCPTSGGRSWRLPCPASLGGVTNTAPDLPTALALSWPGHYARKPWLIGARLILFQLLSMGVQWSRLWSCKACILVRQREAKRTATAEMPSQGQGEPSSGQAAAAVVQPQACPAFQQLVQHLSQDRSASQALTRATQ